MRVLIVAGGTGGHVFPALAVARSLLAHPDAPELLWIGGRRGIEGRVVPEQGITFRRLVLRSLRTVDVNVHNNPSESTGFAGLSGTALIVLVVLAVIVIALIVALASRDHYP